MSASGPGSRFDLAGLLGRGVGDVLARLGEPEVERRSGGQRWLVYETGDLRLRIRCGGAGAEPGAREAGAPGETASRSARGVARREEDGAGRHEDRVATWSVTFREGRESLRAATEPLGLWPAAGPDADACRVTAPLVRRSLPAPGADGAHSLTARVRGGRFVQVTAFDEAPDWL